MTHTGRAYSTIPKSRWPRAIAALRPETMTIYEDGVNILMKPEFDGGWGYFIPRGQRESPEPAGRYSSVGQGVYWYHPY
ncbi:MAG TPA: hypothetical protein VF662_02460 [Allosphingosinicella sp.]